MPIPFSCPFCGQETLVEDEFAGQSGPCATCGKKITVPYVPAEQRFGSNDVVTGIPYKSGPTATTIFLVAIGAIVAATGVIAAIVVLLFPALGVARSFAQRQKCDDNLTRIGEALQAYEAEQGSLPPAYIEGPDGKPMHSWRVLILPYLDEHGIYNDYDFSQPWDSPNNQQLTTSMPSVYSCPAEPDGLSAGESNYMVIVGDPTAFPGAEAMSSNDVGDELAGTILVVEVPVQGVSWLKPQDLDIDRMQYVINGEFGEEISSAHPGGAHVLMADGTVRFLDDLMPSDFLQGMTTANGGESTPWEAFDD